MEGDRKEGRKGKGRGRGRGRENENKEEGGKMRKGRGTEKG